MPKPRRWPLTLLTMRTMIVGFVWLATMAIAFRVGAYAYKYRANIRALLQSVQQEQILQTNLHDVLVQKVAVPTEGRDGGVTGLRDGVLLAGRNGSLWFVDSTKALHELPLRVPINVTEFSSDPANAGVISEDRFAVKDLLIHRQPGGELLLASYTYWHAEPDCYTLRVSSYPLPSGALTSADVAPDAWRTVFETAPCYPLSIDPGGKRHPTLGAGGRMAMLTPNELLVTVGGFKGEIEMDGPDFYWNPSNSYGKTILVNVENGASRVYSVGHRNPQGLTVTSGSEVWLTEHAARGGDELNRIVDGGNYGYPLVSYGTQYEAMTWPTNPHQGRHEGYEKPRFAWVPSVGISQLIEIEGKRFALWKGDLLVASLANLTLYRVRMEDERVIFVEPISIGHRIRDITETAAGTIVLKTDDDFLIYLEALGAGAASIEQLEPKARGQILSSSCRGCHSFESGAPSGIGPNLWGIVGRPIAGADNYNYSAGLRRVRGRWTADNLRAFVFRPDSFAPGTTMQLTTKYTETELNDLIAFLETMK